ncbi:conjugal transfer protein TraL [Helicobacter monodelphidis]|nr:conjugal transfer protein TraL [Helicobacter sp. 15-1451]
MVHIIINAKGGIGKSFVSSLITQYLMDNTKSVIAIDTDPNNTTLLNIKALNAHFIALFNEEGKFERSKFDKLMELIVQKNNDHFVVDCGATTFNPILEYLQENEVIEFLQSQNCEVIMHIPIVGAQAQEETIKGAMKIIEAFNCNFVIWLNGYHGKIERGNKKFDEFEEYQAMKSKLKAVIQLSQVPEDTTGKDLELMTRSNLTFNEAIESGQFNIMSKQRLKIYKRDTYEAMAIAF